MRTKDSAGLSGGILGQIEVSLETAAREGRAERAGEYQDQKGSFHDGSDYEQRHGIFGGGQRQA